MLHTSLTLLKQHGACTSGYRKVIKYLGGAKAAHAYGLIPLTVVLDSNGLDDALWCLRAVPPEEEAERDVLARLYSCDCVEAILNLDAAVGPDGKSEQLILVARRFALGLATRRKLNAARAACAAAHATSGSAVNVAYAYATYASRTSNSPLASTWGATWATNWATTYVVGQTAYSMLRKQYETCLREWLEGIRTAAQVRDRITNTLCP